MSIINIFLLFSHILIQQVKTDSLTLYHGSRLEKKIALTFDACPSSTRSGFDAQIVRTLVDSGVPATFFLSGRWIVKHWNEAKTLAKILSFEFGNHSYSHPHCITISDDSIQHELKLTESLLQKI